MKVIVKGKLPKDKIFKGKCPNCGVEVHATKEDHVAPWSIGTKGRTCIEVKCPTEGCNNNFRCRYKKEKE